MPKLSSTQFPNQWIFLLWCEHWAHLQHKSKKARFKHQWQLMLSWKNTPPVEATFSYTSTQTKTKYALLVLWQRADKSGNFTSKYSANTRSKLYILQWGKTTHVPLKTLILKVAHLTMKDSMSGGERRNQEGWQGTCGWVWEKPSIRFGVEQEQSPVSWFLV